MSGHAHRRHPSRRLAADEAPGRWQRVRLFIAWFFAPRPAPTAWQRRPYLRSRGRRPGRFSR